MHEVKTSVNVLEELLRLLKLEKIEETVFWGQSHDIGYNTIFGGQLLGQALSAASQTVSGDFINHSFHAYFLLPGDVSLPITYEVESIRDGSSFTTRRIRAVQKGHAIFLMSASFHIVESGIEHQDAMPVVEGPEGLTSELELYKKMADQIPERIRDRILFNKPFETRPVFFYNLFKPEKKEPPCYRWFRAVDKISDDPALHQYLLAYASDFHLAATSLHSHGLSAWLPGMQIASLDHAMWFHRPFRIDEWLLYAIESPIAFGSRYLSIGKIFTIDGMLVATVAQEGLHRYRPSDSNDSPFFRQ